MPPKKYIIPFAGFVPGNRTYKCEYIVLLTLVADFFLCRRFSLFIIRNFGNIASRPYRNLYLCPPAFTRFCDFLSGMANKMYARFQLSEDEV